MRVSQQHFASTFRLVVAVAGVGLGCGCAALAGVDAASAAGSYVLVAPLKSAVTYLIDKDGNQVHSWRAATAPGLSAYLLPNGHLLRASNQGTGSFPSGGGNGGRVEEYDWDGHLVWSFDYSSDDVMQHHDARMLPNGHVLMVAWERRSAAEAIAAGRAADTIPANGAVWPDQIVEVDPATNQIVWTWRLWDHLLAPGADPSAYPELVDPNVGASAANSDWTHVNAVDYNPALDQVLISSRNLSEIWIVDHGTTAVEVAGHTGGRYGRGGDLLFRWGHPTNYGLTGPQQLFGQHNAQWIENGLNGAGQILLFDNGDRTLRPYSTVLQLAVPEPDASGYALDPPAGFEPIAPAWEYQANPPETLFAPIISGAQRLPNGNTLVCDGPNGHMIEVTPAGDMVWSYLLTDTAGANGVQVFRATQYEAAYSGLAGHALVPEGPLRVELQP